MAAFIVNLIAGLRRFQWPELCEYSDSCTKILIQNKENDGRDSG